MTVRHTTKTGLARVAMRVTTHTVLGDHSIAEGMANIRHGGESSTNVAKLC